MGLPTVNLDDRDFQSIVDEAKKRIAATCPDWTDHNVSDPGVTLVELFAWMTEMIIYRLNQVPEKNYIKLMELMGLTLESPEPAKTDVTFYLSTPQKQQLLIRRGTEVATDQGMNREAMQPTQVQAEAGRQSEAAPDRADNLAPVVFSTEADLVIHPPVLKMIFTGELPSEPGGKPVYREHNLKQMGAAGFPPIIVFGKAPVVGNALYLGFDNNLSYHVLQLDMLCPTAGGMGIREDDPPWAWEVSAGGEDATWSPAVVELKSDTTGGMNKDGSIRLRLPRMALAELPGGSEQQAYWLRCRNVPPAHKGQGYKESPRLSLVVANSVGGSVPATHASIVGDEQLGRSDGSPGQVFQVEYRPLLRRWEEEKIEVRPPGSTEWEPWIEVPDFADSEPTDRHYTCDSATGEIRFGPALRQPNGKTKSFGAFPARGAQIRFSAYRHGGGVAGNLLPGSLTVIKTSIPYVDSVTNYGDATGGIDAETVEMAQLRAPQFLRARGRAVTESDFEALVLDRKSNLPIERARCLQPHATGGKDDLAGGRVYLLIVPKVNHPDERIRLEQLRVTDELREAVRRYLDNYRLLTVRLDIREPEYLRVKVEIVVAPRAGTDHDRVREAVERQLYRFLNPIRGGPAGKGWPFGRLLYPSDVYATLQSVRGIEYIESLKLNLVRANGDETEIPGRLPVPLHGLVASAEHIVRIKAE